MWARLLQVPHIVSPDGVPALHLVLMAKLLFLLAVANGAPVLAKWLLGRRYACPLDGGRRFFDGRPLFGRSKTVRGLLVSVGFTALAAWLIGFGFATGMIVAGVAMLGDLFSSFMKRRLGLAPSSRALGLDQIPESLLPLLVCRETFALTMTDIAGIVAVFFAGELVLSRVLYEFGIRERPY